MEKPIEVFLRTLEDLGAEDFERFKWFLEQEVLEGFPAIPKSRLEGVNRMDTVDQMVKNYSINTIKVIRIVLKEINQNDLVAKLPKTISEPEGKSWHEDQSVILQRLQQTSVKHERSQFDPQR